MRYQSLPSHLRERFHGRRFVPVDPPAFLDQEGAEIILIGAGGVGCAGITGPGNVDDKLWIPMCRHIGESVWIRARPA